MARIARRLWVHGRVQGVSFRDWAVATAQGLGLDGWVRNRADGRVEALAAGEEEAVDAFVTRCREGPAAAGVEQLEVEEASASGAVAGFARRPTV